MNNNITMQYNNVFSILIAKIINNNRYNPHKQKFFEVLDNF